MKCGLLSRFSVFVLLVVVYSSIQKYFNTLFYCFILSGKYTFTNEEKTSLSHQVKDLLTRILRRNPDERLSLGRILSHPWMEKYAQYTVRRVKGLNHNHNNHNNNNNNNTDTNSTAISLTTANTNAMVISLLLRRIGDIAATVRQIGHNFRRLLLSVAYPLLEKLSDPHPVVCQSAHSTLIRVSECCGYNGISSMLQDNMDYLVDAVCAKLTRPGERSGTALVVRSIVTQDDTLDGTGTFQN